MPNSENSISHTINSYLGLPSTCAGKIARVFAAVAACAFTSSLSSAITASGIYLLDRGLEIECSAAALSSFSIVTSIVGTISLISAVGIGYGLCSNYDVYNSSVSSISPTPSIAVAPSSRGISSSSLSPCNISSSISPQHSSTDSGFSFAHGVVPILSKSKPIKCVTFLEFMETSL